MPSFWMAPLFFSENNLTSLTKMKSVTLPVIFFYSFHLPCVYVHGCPLWHWCWSVTLPVEYLLLFHLPCIYVRGCPVWHQCWLFRMELYIAGTVHPSIRHQQGQAGGSVAWRVVYIPHLHYQVSLCGYGMGAEVEPFSIPVAVLICSSFSFVFTPPQPAACFKKLKSPRDKGLDGNVLNSSPCDILNIYVYFVNVMWDGFLCVCVIIIFYVDQCCQIWNIGFFF